ncbi:hypothetical protein D3C81_1691310 [compost metagenome]
MLSWFWASLVAWGISCRLKKNSDSRSCGRSFGRPLICTDWSLPAASLNRAGDVMNGTGVVVSSAWVLTQVWAAKGRWLGLAITTEALRWVLS